MLAYGQLKYLEFLLKRLFMAAWPVIVNYERLLCVFVCD